MRKAYTNLRHSLEIAPNGSTIFEESCLTPNEVDVRNRIYLLRDLVFRKKRRRDILAGINAEVSRPFGRNPKIAYLSPASANRRISHTKKNNYESTIS
ncbi:Unannotated [Lentimonas sp. CC4]|nr:Unannotated [Lentimonas sp. CC4]CAA6683821.1 Unannotated [Lentimonas sp. CC6]CAA7077781.1 Unannotated [Lentimonas sp. CC4]CAA7169714.1 Unannotated [Lentimonas sp. CC21]CAA7179535.1 Unannotated [Lentimonas sp. CC8]